MGSWLFLSRAHTKRSGWWRRSTSVNPGEMSGCETAKIQSQFSTYLPGEADPTESGHRRR